MKVDVKKEIFEWIVCIVVALLAYFVINYFLGTIAGVKQSSMHPTIKTGERVLIGRRVLYNKTLSRGDIIILEAPNGYINIENTTNIAQYKEYTGIANFAYKVLGIGKKSYIKRIIGLSGDHIYISEEGQVYVNEQLLKEEYLDSSVTTPRNGKNYDIIVPQNCVFVMGDNRRDSRDSREFGTIPMNRVEGKVSIRIWPFNKIGKI